MEKRLYIIIKDSKKADLTTILICNYFYSDLKKYRNLI